MLVNLLLNLLQLLLLLVESFRHVLDILLLLDDIGPRELSPASVVLETNISRSSRHLDLRPQAPHPGFQTRLGFLGSSNFTLHLQHRRLGSAVRVGQKLEVRTSEEERVQLALIRGSEERLCGVLRQERERRVNVEIEVVHDVLELDRLLLDDVAATNRTELVLRSTIAINDTLNDDVVGVPVGFERIWALVGDRESDDRAAECQSLTAQNHLLCTVHDQVLYPLATTSDCRLGSKGHCDGGEDGTLAAAVVTDEEVQARRELHCQVLVTHKVHEIDTLENSSFRHSLLLVS